MLVLNSWMMSNSRGVELNTCPCNVANVLLTYYGPSRATVYLGAAEPSITIYACGVQKYINFMSSLPIFAIGHFRFRLESTGTTSPP